MSISRGRILKHTNENAETGSENKSDDDNIHTGGDQGRRKENDDTRIADGGDDDVDVDEVNVDGVLSQELMKMSIVDRNAILEEIHGARCLATQETPELIRKSLQEFQRELDKDTDSSGRSSSSSDYLPSKQFAYRILLKQQQLKRERNSTFSPADMSSPTKKKHRSDSCFNYAIDDDNFRLRFLRCELFNVPKAVRRFYNYLDYVYEYWGEVALKRPIRFTDFTKAEQKLFRKGFFQLLPFRDSSGRRVMVFLGGMDPHQDIRARNKICFYMWDVVTRDSVESQQKGFIIIRLHGNVSTEDTTGSSEGSDTNDSKNSGAGASSPNTNFRSVTNNLNRSFSSIPSRVVASHTRIPNHPGFRLVFKLFVIQVFTEENVSLRPRFVPCPASSDMETRYRLKSYGIPTQLLPMTDTNSIKCTYNNQWMKTRKLLEEREFDNPDQNNTTSGSASSVATSSENSELVECPGLNDVVFRKGSRVTSIENPGNRFFRDLIRTFLEEKERVSEKLKQEEIDPLSVTAGGIDDSFSQQSVSSSTKGTAIVSPPTLSPESSTTSSVGGKKNTGKAFCDWLVDYIENERKGRFLEWNTTVNGWVVMSDKIQISRKASITLYNWGKRLSAETAAAKKQSQRANPAPSISSNDNRNVHASGIRNNYNYNSSSSNSVGAGVDDFNDYRFIDGRRPPFEQEGPCCISSSPWSIHSGTTRPATSGKKRPRNDASFARANRPIPFSWDNPNFL